MDVVNPPFALGPAIGAVVRASRHLITLIVLVAALFSRFFFAVFLVNNELLYEAVPIGSHIVVTYVIILALGFLLFFVHGIATADSKIRLWTLVRRYGIAEQLWNGMEWSSFETFPTYFANGILACFGKLLKQFGITNTQDYKLAYDTHLRCNGVLCIYGVLNAVIVMWYGIDSYTPYIVSVELVCRVYLSLKLQKAIPMAVQLDAQEPHDHQDGPQQEPHDHQDGPRQEPHDHQDGPRQEPHDHQDGLQQERHDHQDGPQQELHDHQDGPRQERHDHQDGPRQEHHDHQDGLQQELHAVQDGPQHADQKVPDPQPICVPDAIQLDRTDTPPIEQPCAVLQPDPINNINIIQPGVDSESDDDSGVQDYESEFGFPYAVPQVYFPYTLCDGNCSNHTPEFCPKKLIRTFR